MNEYRVEFSYRLATGEYRTEVDTLMASTSSEAVEKVSEWYSDLVAFRVERVWVDRNNRWEDIHYDN